MGVQYKLSQVGPWLTHVSVEAQGQANSKALGMGLTSIDVFLILLVGSVRSDRYSDNSGWSTHLDRVDDDGEFVG